MSENTDAPLATATKGLDGIIGTNVVDPLPPNMPRGGKFRPTETVGAPGYVVMGGWLHSREKDHTLIGRNRWQTYDNNLLNVGIIGAGVRYYLDLVAGGAAWTFTPADESQAAADIAEFVENALMHDLDVTTWEKVVKKAATYKFHGFSVAEWTAKSRDDGRIGFSDIDNRPQLTIEKWEISDRNEVVGIWQRNPSTGAWLFLPRDKLLYIVDDVLDPSPEGLGLYRHLVRGADGIVRFEDLEHWGFESDLRGIPLGRAPLGELQRQVDDGIITQAQAEAAKAVMSGFIENHIRGPKNGLMLDSATYTTQDEKQMPTAQRYWDVELLKAGGVSHETIGKSIRRKTFEAARIIGCEFLLLGEDGSGSLALAEQAKERLYHMVNSTRGEVSAPVNSQLIATLGRLNNIPKALLPKCQPAKVEHRTVEQVVNSLVGMAQAGAPLMPDDPAINEVRDMVGLSRVEATLAEMDAMLSGGQQQQQSAQQQHDDNLDSTTNKSVAKNIATKKSVAQTLSPAVRVSLAMLQSALRHMPDAMETV